MIYLTLPSSKSYFFSSNCPLFDADDWQNSEYLKFAFIPIFYIDYIAFWSHVLILKPRQFWDFYYDMWISQYPSSLLQFLKWAILALKKRTFGTSKKKYLQCFREA